MNACYILVYGVRTGFRGLSRCILFIYVLHAPLYIIHKLYQRAMSRLMLIVHSTWGNTFLKQETEATDPDCLSAWYLGCNGFVIQSPEATIYVDPYFGDGDPSTWYRMLPIPLDPAAVTECDAVLVTHEHFDHFHPDSYGPMVEDLDTDLYASACFESPQKDWSDLRAPESRCHTVEPGIRSASAT